MSIATIVLLAAGASNTLRFEDWSVVVRPEPKSRMIALTVNDSGGGFGLVCDNSQSCFYMMSSDMKCRNGEEYAVLLNSDSGANSTFVKCDGDLTKDGTYYYIFSEYDLLTRAVAGGRKIGIAFPTEDGSFRVSRYSLRGEAEATDYMTRMLKVREKESTSDLRL